MFMEKKRRKPKYVEEPILFKGALVINRKTGRPGTVDMVITSRRFRVDYGNGEKVVEKVTALDQAL